jgi:ABC-type phosphate/phosphonate transport system substrate-binding protein
MTPVANARMYSPCPPAREAWKELLAWVIRRAELDWAVVDHDPPAMLAALWARDDFGCVQMCGLPHSRRAPQPRLVAAPIPSPARYEGRPVYFSDLIVRADAPFDRLADALARRVGYTLTHSQSGYFALRYHLLGRGLRPGAIVGPLVTARRVIEVVVAREIDVGPIDSYVHDILRFHEPALAAQVRVLETTDPTPIPPFVATAPVDDATLGRLREGFLAAATEAALAPVRTALQLRGFAIMRPEDYDMQRRRAERVEAVGEDWRAEEGR